MVNQISTGGWKRWLPTGSMYSFLSRCTARGRPGAAGRDAAMDLSVPVPELAGYRM